MSFNILSHWPTTVITASSQSGSYPASNLNQGISAGTGITKAWLSASSVSFPVSVFFDFYTGSGTKQYFKKIEIVKMSYQSNTASPKDFTLWVSEYGVSWQQVFADKAALTQPASSLDSEIITLNDRQFQGFLEIRFSSNWGSVDYVGMQEVIITDDYIDLSGDGVTTITVGSYNASYPKTPLEVALFAGTVAWIAASNHLYDISVLWNFGSAKYVEGLMIATYASGNYGPKNYSVYVSDDNILWGTLTKYGQFDAPPATNGVILYADLSADMRLKQYLKLLMKDVHNPSYIPGLHKCRAYQSFAGAGDPPAPETPVAYGYGTGGVLVQWTYANKPYNFSHYEVYRSVDGGGLVEVTLDDSLVHGFFDDAAPPAGTLYAYRIKAVNKSDLASAYTALSNQTTKGSSGGSLLGLRAAPGEVRA